MNAKNDKAPEKGAENPGPAKGMDSASGAVIEPEIKEGVQMDHASVDANPREGTTAQQNARDMNDPRRRKPNDRDFAGQGIDPAPYGRKAEPKAKKGRK